MQYPTVISRYCLLIVGGLVLFSSFTVSVFAQEIRREPVEAGSYGDFVVGPGKVELPLSPGESRTIELTVTNRLGETRQFNLEVEDATGSTDPGRPVVLLGDEVGPYTLKDYLIIPETSFVLNAGERARIPVTVSIPADAEPGGRYGSVLVTTTTVDGDNRLSSDARPSSPVITRIGTLFFITTPGDIEFDGALQSFSTIPESGVFSSGPIDFSILYENTGSVHVNPYGSISIRNMLGDEVGFIQLDPWYALPQSLRFRQATFEREFLFGRYQATLELNRGYQDIVDTTSVVFWVLPWRVVLPVVGSIILLILMIRYVITNFEFRRKE